MINDKLKPILSELTKKTIRKEAIWNKASGENQFILILSEGITLAVSYVEADQFNEDYYTVSVFNRNGDLIQRYYTDHNTPDDDRELIQTFFRAASDAYYRVDETFDALLKSVTSEGTIGKIVEKGPSSDDDDLPF
jgi:hypothetical protein